jgi:hypothetical protein
MLPLPHRNTIELFGVERKSDYLVWREKLGFFTALNKNTLKLQTWALSSGKMITEEQLSMELTTLLRNYEVYQANQDDSSYVKDFQNKSNFSIQLLKSKTPKIAADYSCL